MSKYDIIKASIYGLAVTLLLKPGTVLAEGLVNCGNTLNDKCTINHAFDLIISIINLAIQFSGLIAVLMIVVNGFKMTGAGLSGSSELYTDAKAGLWNAITGFVLILFAYTLVNLVWGMIMPAEYATTWFKPWQ